MPLAASCCEHLGVGVDAVGGEERAVLDRVRTDGEGVGDGLGAVGVHGQRQSGGVRLLESDGELGAPNCDSCGPTVGVMFPPLAITLMTSTPRATRSRTAWRDAVGAVDLAAEEPAVPVRDVVIGGPGGDDARADLVAGEEPVAQREREVVAVAEVADRRDARRRGPAARRAACAAAAWRRRRRRAGPRGRSTRRRRGAGGRR